MIHTRTHAPFVRCTSKCRNSERDDERVERNRNGGRPREGGIRVGENKEAIVGELEAFIKARMRERERARGTDSPPHTHTHPHTEDCSLPGPYNHTDAMWRKRPALFCPRLLSIALLASSISASSSSLARNATRRPGAPDPRLFSKGEDYNNIYDETFNTEPTVKPAGSPSPLCDYDICKDQQESCQNLALALSCSCPGITGPFHPPDPPSLQSLSSESKGAGVVVRWCAPPSTITHYLVLVEGQDEARQAREDRRMMELEDLAPGTEVCVGAVNKVGVSTRGKESCARFEPNSSETRLAVKLALIGAAVVLVVVILVGALLLWWCRRHRKTPTRTPNPRTEVVL